MDAKEARMAEAVIRLRLNQQQLELMDRTIARGVAPDRAALVRLALREYAVARKAETKAKPNDSKPSDLGPVR
jgi:Arc/MetJ-type ribon-helix-helix transcriptional regulator